MSILRIVRLVTAAALGAVAIVHAAWGRGSTFPFADATELTDAVVGRPSASVPAPAACFAVAGALVTAAAVVAGVPFRPERTRRQAAAVVTGVLAGRGALGLAGRTSLVSPGSTSPRFVRNDRRIYAPLCLALAAGSALAVARRTTSGGSGHG